ncbi:MAG TPA: cysteine desulfurase family protein [Candidatus Hydrogenedentes bacterium]|nr:cysteine desulfurase family protein [Candidatus Hydrogenedentota bacterium]
MIATDSPELRRNRERQQGAMSRIYLDHNATTPVDSASFEAMLPYLRDSFGNPSSVHAWGREARVAIDRARRQVAALINAEPDEIVFTGGGTESTNAALVGGMMGISASTLVVSAVEHLAVLGPAEHLASRGAGVRRAPVDGNGCLERESLDALFPHASFLVSVMLANHDTGALQPLREVVDLAHARGGIVHTDAIQAAGRVPIDVKQLQVDLLSLSAHKLYGPKGVGALYVRRETPFTPLLRGGRHEDGRRAGTENVAGIVGFGVACERVAPSLTTDADAVRGLRDRLETEVLARIGGASVNARDAARLPNTSSIRFDGVEADMVVMALDLEGIAVSAGSACTSASREPSHVLRAMGQTPEQARSAVRFSFGRANTQTDVCTTVETLVRVMARLREAQR